MKTNRCEEETERKKKNYVFREALCEAFRLLCSTETFSMIMKNTNNCKKDTK